MPMTEARWLQSEQTEVMMQVYPEKVAALPPQQLQTLLHTLEFGIAAPEPEAVQSALEALAALARFDYQSKQSGQAGLQAGPGTPPAPLKHVSSLCSTGAMQPLKDAWNRTCFPCHVSVSVSRFRYSCS